MVARSQDDQPAVPIPIKYKTTNPPKNRLQPITANDLEPLDVVSAWVLSMSPFARRKSLNNVENNVENNAWSRDGDLLLKTQSDVR